MTEIWKNIPGYPGYQASDMGRIMGKLGAVMIPQKDSSSNWRVGPYKDGKRHTALVGHLVLQAFCGSCPKGQQCRHGPCGRSCHELSNLCWGTSAENRADTIRDGTMPNIRGEKHGKSKLTKPEVLEIRGLRGKMLLREIATKFGISVSHVCTIQTGRNWAWLKGPEK